MTKLRSDARSGLNLGLSFALLVAAIGLANAADEEARDSAREQAARRPLPAHRQAGRCGCTSREERLLASGPRHPPGRPGGRPAKDPRGRERAARRVGGGQEARRHLEPGRGAAVDHALGSRARPHRQFPGDPPAEPERPVGDLHHPAGHGGGRGTEPLRAVREPRVPGLRQERNAGGPGLPPEQPVHEHRRRLRRPRQRRPHRPLRPARRPLAAQPVRLGGASTRPRRPSTSASRSRRPATRPAPTTSTTSSSRAATSTTTRKLGVWPDGYYMTAPLFEPAARLRRPGRLRLDRAKMLAGRRHRRAGLLRPVGFAPGPAADPARRPRRRRPRRRARPTTSPLHRDRVRRPAGRDPAFRVRPDFTNPAASTFTELPRVGVASFDPT